MTRVPLLVANSEYYSVIQLCYASLEGSELRFLLN